MKTEFLTGMFPKRAFLLTLAATVLFSINTMAQGAAKLVGASIIVNGTSNIHDWTMKSGALSSTANFAVKGSELLAINGLSFTLPVQTLKSDENLLNTRAYKAMKADKHKDISFRISNATVTPQGAVKATGLLTIAGVTRELQLNATAKVNADKTISITGQRKLRMSEFGIAPPSFMMGALKVKDDMTIDYTLRFQ